MPAAPCPLRRMANTLTKSGICSSITNAVSRHGRGRVAMLVSLQSVRSEPLLTTSSQAVLQLREHRSLIVGRYDSARQMRACGVMKRPRSCVPALESLRWPCTNVLIAYQGPRVMTCNCRHTCLMSLIAQVKAGEILFPRSCSWHMSVLVCTGAKMRNLP